MLRKRFKGGFTLVEINLAIFVMAVGILSVCQLYSLGYRENRQSVEDVASAAYADAYFAPLVQALSATNLPWSSWRAIGDAIDEDGGADAVWPSDGWAAYVGSPSRSSSRESGSDGISDIEFSIAKNCTAIADGVFGQVKGKTPKCGSKPSIPSKYTYGFVVSRSGTVIKLSMKIARRREMLMAQGTFSTEVRFQGDPNL